MVLDADATLRFPDFRAEERTFALIAQLAGRVGRGGRRARAGADDRARGARRSCTPPRHDSDGFIAGELERRRALGYPPFSHLIRIVCSPPSRRRAARAAAARGARGARASAGRERRSAIDGRPGRARPGVAVSPARPRAPGAGREGARAPRGRAGGRRGRAGASPPRARTPA